MKQIQIRKNTKGNVRSKYDPLFDYLGKYVARITIPASNAVQEVVVMDSIPPSEIVNLPRDLLALYRELLAGGGTSPWVHLPSCPIVYRP